MSFIPLIGPVVDGLKSIFGFIDSVHTSEDEKLSKKAQLLELFMPLLMAAVETQARLSDAQARIIEAEAHSESWLTRTWRPIMMLAMLAVILYGVFFNMPVPEPVWTLLQLGMSGYIIGRSAEKVVPPILNALKGKEHV